MHQMWSSVNGGLDLRKCVELHRFLGSCSLPLTTPLQIIAVSNRLFLLRFFSKKLSFTHRLNCIIFLQRRGLRH